MPLSRINTNSIANNSINASDLLDASVTAAKILSVANTQITGNIVSSQITSVANTQISGNIIGSQISRNTWSNTVFQTGSVENYLNSQSMNLGMRNRIINGNMAINQRGTTSGITSGYFVDRWTLSGCSTSATLTSSLPTGFSSGISINATSGNPIAIQKIEAKNCSDLSGRNVTLSFYAKNLSNATTLYASLAYATASDNFGSTTTISEQNLGTLTSDWVRYTYTWTNLASGVLNGLALNLLCAGTGTFSMGITGVQLEVGNAPTPFEFRHFGTELQLCQRYYQQTNSFTGVGASASLYGIVTFPVIMRSSPSIGQTAALQITDGVTNDWTQSPTSISINSSRVSIYGVDFTADNFASVTNYRPYFAKQNVTGLITLSAEL